LLAEASVRSDDREVGMKPSKYSNERPSYWVVSTAIAHRLKEAQRAVQVRSIKGVAEDQKSERTGSYEDH
jgi:hypothetical protein